jgi:hypothetical protein
MTTLSIEQLRFPIGKFVKPESVSPEALRDCMARIASFPARLKNEVAMLNDEQLDTHYRPEGWTVRQVVHHCADSHMNALIRFKLTLTEESPVIKPYKEHLFAELSDYRLPVDSALQILDGVHARLCTLIRDMRAEDFERYYVHPEYGANYRLDHAVLLYAWHGDHHLAHITELKKRMQW